MAGHGGAAKPARRSFLALPRNGCVRYLLLWLVALFMLLGCVFAGSVGLLPGRFANLVTGGSSGATTQSETLPAAQAPTVAPAAPVSNVSTSSQGGGSAASAPSAGV